MTKINTNSAISPAALIASAFKLSNEATKAGNNGVQVMAAGIMLHHADKLNNTRATFDKMGEGGEAFKLFKDELVQEFVTPRMKDKGNKVDEVTKANRDNATQMVALNKGFALAIALDTIGVTSRSFDPATRVFSVPVTALMPKEATPIGQLAKFAKADNVIPLNGAAYACMDADEKLVRFNAFPARVLELAGYKKTKGISAKAKQAEAVKGASETTSNGGADAGTLNNTPAAWGFDKLVQSAGMLLNKAADILADGKEGAEQVTWSSLDDATRNAIEAVLIFRDECKAAEQLVTKAA